MYLKEINDENIGPISRLNIKMPFDANQNPKPLILVGENGSGKSIVLSNIVDSFYEFARQAYNDVAISDGRSSKYYKIITSNQIRLGEKYAYSYLKYFSNNNNIEYLLKNGNLSYADLKSKYPELSLTYTDEGKNEKETTQNESLYMDAFEKGSYCYFPPNRYSIPSWLNKDYTKDNMIKIGQRFKGILNKPISINNMEKNNLSWLLDIIVDSRPDVIKNKDGSYSMENISIPNLDLLSMSRKNVEEILSEILGNPVKLTLNHRNSYDSRFNVKNESGKTIIPSLDSLSTGQMALFNMFTTIIKYSDMRDVNKSVHLSEIEGIVVIDEIELHLHSILQKEILPKLLKKFPRVQFIITSHSPLFLLGMEEVYGKDGFEIYNMPFGEKIGTERFSEFNKTYQYMKNTSTYENDLRNCIEENLLKEKNLIVTEGCTDWRHLKRAFEKIKNDERYKAEFEDLDIEFLMYDDTNIKDSDLITFDMGDSKLISMCEFYSRMKQDKKIIFIGDRDKKDEEILSSDGNNYKNWGNNVFSFQIPIPSHRVETPDVCIEHYYTDDEIKTEFLCDDGIRRRLYIGNEFNDKGVNSTKDRMCKCLNKCGEGKIDIIEGSSKEKVTSLEDNDTTNYALSKKFFAENVYNNIGDFSNLGYENFVEIFKIIKEIMN